MEICKCGSMTTVKVRSPSNCTDQLGQSLVLGLFMKYVLRQFLGDAERLWYVIAAVFLR